MANQRKNRRAYLDDFVLNEKGEYEYKGEVYTLVKADGQKVTKTMMFWAALALGAAAVGGFVPFSGMSGNISIVVSYLVEFGATLALAYSVYVFMTNHKELRSYKYKKSVERIKPMATIVIIAEMLGVIACAIYLLKHHIDTAGILFVLCKGVGFIGVKRCLDLNNSLEFRVKK